MPGCRQSEIGRACCAEVAPGPKHTKLEMTTAFITMSNAHKQHNKRFRGVRGQHWLVLFLLRGPGYVMVEGGLRCKTDFGNISEIRKQTHKKYSRKTKKMEGCFQFLSSNI